MQSSNPVLRNLGGVAQRERTATYPQSGYGSGYGQGYGSGGQGYGQPGYQQYPQAGYPPYQQYPPVIQRGATRAMTVDDVVTRTVFLILLTGVVAAISWIFLRGGPTATLFVAGSSIGGLVLGLVISFARITNPALICVYAVLQGILLGVVSRIFEEVYAGIVIQAVGGTFAVFAGMAVLYRFRVLRATPKFTRFVIGALFGIVALSLLNWVFAMFGHNLGIQYYSPLEGHGHPWAILFSIAAIVVGALTFIIDLDAVEQGVRYGLPERYAWYTAFGLLVGLIFLYWQILRLLGYLRR